MDQGIVDYIKKSRELGYSDEAIKTLLINAGHQEEDVRVAFDVADGKSSSQGKNIISPTSGSQSGASSSGSKTITSLRKTNLLARGLILTVLPLISAAIGFFLYPILGKQGFFLYPILVEGYEGFFLGFWSMVIGFAWAIIINQSFFPILKENVVGKKLLIFSATFVPIVLVLIIFFAIYVILFNPLGMMEAQKRYYYESRDIMKDNDISALSFQISLYQATTDGILSCVSGKVYSSRDGTRAIDGTGWLPIDLAKMEYGSPIAELFIDPNNNSSYFYSYASDPVSNKYELNTRFEGETYKRDTKGDGGNNPDVYEVGTDLNLIK